MRAVTDGYAAKLAQLAKSPAYAVRFFHIDRLAAGVASAFSVDFVSHATPGLTRPSLQLLAAPRGNTATAQPEEGRSSLGVFALPLVDLDNEITRYLANPQGALAVALSSTGGETTVQLVGEVAGYPSRGTLLLGTERIRYTARNTVTKCFTSCTRAVDGTVLTAHAAATVVQNGEQIRAGQRVQLYAGYQDMEFAEWLPFAMMEISGVSMESAVQYVIACADVQRMTTQIIFLSATQESPSQFAGHPVDLLLEWLISDGSAAVSTGTVQVTGSTRVVGVGTFFHQGNFLQPDDWVVLGLGDADHHQYAQVLEVVSETVFTSRNLLTPGPAGLAYRRCGASSKYNALAAFDGCAVPPALVDLAGLEALRDGAFAGQRYLYRINGPAEAKATFETHVKSMNCYPIVTGLGQWGLKHYTATAQTAVPVAALTEATIVSWAWTGSEDKIVNVAEFQYDWNLAPTTPTTGGAPTDYLTRQRYRALDSIRKYGARGVFRVSAPGVRTAYGAQAILDDRAFRLFTRYADPPAELRVFCFYGTQQLEVGDIVSVTHPRIPNRRTGQRGLDAERFEVRDLRPLFGAGGGMLFTLLHVGGMAVIAVPVSDGTENNLKTLIVNRAAFANEAAVALSTTETEVARVTIPLQRTTDGLLIQGGQYLDADVPSLADYAVSRLRHTSIAGTLIGSSSPPTELQISGKGVQTGRSVGNVSHDALFVPGVTGQVTILMTAAIVSAGAPTGWASQRELAVTQRSR